MRVHAPIGVAFDLSRCIEVQLLGSVREGEQAMTLQVGNRKTSGLVSLGQKVTWRARHLGRQRVYTMAITRMEPPRMFEETMLEGPLRFMRNEHRFAAKAGGWTVVESTLRVEADVPLLGRMTERYVLRKYMKNLLRERLLAMKKEAETGDWLRYLPLEGGVPWATWAAPACVPGQDVGGGANVCAGGEQAGVMAGAEGMAADVSGEGAGGPILHEGIKQG